MESLFTSTLSLSFIAIDLKKVAGNKLFWFHNLWWFPKFLPKKVDEAIMAEFQNCPNVRQTFSSKPAESNRVHWSDSNFIPIESKKFEFWNLNLAIRICIKNDSEIGIMRSRDFRNILNFSIWNFETLTRFCGNTVFRN